jgi:general secretion pathway protein H
MPISVPGISNTKNRGFTLIELLVVLLIMGLFAGLVAALAQPDDRMLLRVEAERLAQLLDLAAVEARLTGNPIAWTAGMTPEGAQYRFWRWRDDAGWLEAGDDSLRARSLRPGMVISELRIEAMRPPGELRLEFSPNGSLAYDFQMSLGTARYGVAASPLGEVRVHASP